MKKISLKEAFQILEDCSAVIFDDSVLVYPSLSDLEDVPDNEFLYLSWESEGLEYYLKFCEGDNKEVEISGSSMFLFDTDAGEDKLPVQITILEPKTL